LLSFVVYLFNLDKSLIGCVPKQQIKYLTLFMNENNFEITRKQYTETIYSHICVGFENLKYLKIFILSAYYEYILSWADYPVSSLNDLPSTVFSSSSLTELHIHVRGFDDFICLLDGRLKQLSRLFVEIDFMSNETSSSANRVSLSLTMIINQNYSLSISL